ncbi:MAG: sulfurtransferase [Betaproteobacteria bacterium]|nr:sulfurtransferase [Betaproteobacteria bacterium]
MRRLRTLIALIALAPLGVLAQGYADEDRDWGVAPSQSLRRPPYTAPTPREIPGARVVRTGELKEMMAGTDRPLLIDVASGEGRLTIEGALWLAGAGRGANFIDPLQAELAQWLAKTTGGDKAKPLVWFCVNPQCWLSYNAALRAVALGYSRVYWYRGGVEAWRAAGLPIARTGAVR